MEALPAEFVVYLGQTDLDHPDGVLQFVPEYLDLMDKTDFVVDKTA